LSRRPFDYKRSMNEWRKTWNIGTTILYLLTATPSQADSLGSCFTSAGQRYGIAPSLLQAMARAESGLDALARHANIDGSVDIGLMQINSVWLPLLQRSGIAPEMLWHPCYNIHVGAWILAGNIRRFGYTWEAVGAYNAGTRQDRKTESRREAYAHRIYRHLPCTANRLRCPTSN